MRASLYVVAMSFVLLARHSEGQIPQAVRFELNRGGAIVLPVTIDGKGPFRFRLDTGSTRTVISEDLAQTLGLPFVGSTRVVTASGQVTRPIARVARMAIGVGAVNDVTAVIQPRRALTGGPALDGFVGQDILGPLAYTIDYSRQTISWSNSSATRAPALRLPLLIASDRVLVSLPQGQGPGAPLQLIPDSGADGVVLFARTAEPPVPVTPLEPAAIRTVSGQAAARRVRIDDLRVGDVSLQNHPAVLVDASALDTRLGDGLLPLHLFERVSFNGPGRYLMVEGRRQ